MRQRFNVQYEYLATGMEGRADIRDLGDFEAEDERDAINQAATKAYPGDSPAQKEAREWTVFFSTAKLIKE